MTKYKVKKLNKVYISADIEGVAGISSWSEQTEADSWYQYFAEQMSREVAAACEVALEFADEVFVRDAHATARNMNPKLFPKGVKFVRNWSGDPRHMMDGIDETCDCCFMIGYHGAAGSDSNPLAHTMSSRRIFEMRLNGERMSECYLNELIANYYGVPLVLLAGDKGLCEEAQAKNPDLEIAITAEGLGASTCSIHPDLALEEIAGATRRALEKEVTLSDQDKKKRKEELFDKVKGTDLVFQITFKDHADCFKASFYPGVEKIDERTVEFKTDDYYEIMRFILFAF